MSINCTNRDALEAFMKHNLKEKRYIHSLGVEKMARYLASVHGADEEKAAFAGRYHDIAKCFSDEMENRYIREYGISEKFANSNALAHSKVAAEILKNEFGVDNEEVLDAVRSHTTGRRGMSLLEEIVYVADAIEENRNYPGLRALQQQAAEDLDGACLFIMDYTIDTIKKKGRTLDADTIEAREFICSRIRSTNGQ